MNQKEILLECQNVSFRYNSGVWILKHINLQIFSGERVGLIAPSGYGKSTLSRLLAGYEKPLAWKILWKGKPFPETGYCPVQMIYQHPEKALNPRWRLKNSLYEAWNPDDALLKELQINKKLWLTDSRMNFPEVNCKDSVLQEYSARKQNLLLLMK